MPTGQASKLISEWILGRILASRDATAERHRETGRFVMTYPRMFRRLIAMFLVLSTGFLILGMAGTADDTKALLLITAIFGLLWLAMAYGFYEMLFVRIEFSEEGLFQDSPLKRQAFIPWSQVRRVDYSESMKWFRFRTESGTIRVSVYRNGLESLADVLSSVSQIGDAAALVRTKMANPL